MVNIDGATISDVADSDANHPHSFDINPSPKVAAMGKEWGRIFHLRAETAEDKAVWLEQLRRAAAGRLSTSSKARPLSARDFYL